jgi:uroporphyrin-III C-methyltransferase
MNRLTLSEQRPGTVSLVGAGPGDPELLSLKAWQRIRMADVLIYDHLISSEVVDMACAQAQRLYVGKSSGLHTLPQDDICRLLIEKARTGKRVVRLKGGDPFVFGRGGEEMSELLKEGIEVEIIPGITAALGAASAFGFPLTHRDHAQSCVFVTGHLKEEGAEPDWQALARPGQTLVIYMGVKGLSGICRQLQDAGLSPDTPAALVYRATWPTQAIYRSTLAGLPQKAQQEAVKPPSLLVVGSVLNVAMD